MGLLHDIQQELLDPKSEIGPILLKLRYLASKLGSNAMEDWVRYETEGYPKDVEVPEYRKAGLNYSGTFTNGFQVINSAPIPTATILKVGGPSWVSFSIRDSIAVIDKIVATENSPVGKMGIAAGDLVPRLNNKVFEGMGAISVKAEFGGAPFIHIHSLVRAKILDLTLELERKLPIASAIAVGTSPPDVDADASGTAAKIIQYVIYGNQTNISNTATEGSSIRIGVIVGDDASLIEHLTAHGVPREAAIELAAAAAEEPPESPEQPIGAKAKEWVAKVSGGVWDVTKEVATAVITEALKSYYGLAA